MIGTESVEDVFDRRRRRAVKRDALLQVAAELFNKKGYAATSLDEVATRLTITKTALYYYVRNKPTLLCECYERTLEFCENLMAECEAHDGDGHEGDGLSRVRRYFRDLITGLTGSGPLAVVHEFDVLPEDSRKVIHARARGLDRRLEAFISQGVADGSIADLPPKITELLLMGANNWIQRWYREEGQASLDEVADLFVTLFTNGLAPRRPTVQPTPTGKEPTP